MDSVRSADPEYAWSGSEPSAGTGSPSGRVEGTMTILPDAREARRDETERDEA